MAEDIFYNADSDSEWYQNLKRYGSSLTLLRLLKEDCSLIHQLGLHDVTALHKGVEHGCVALVRFILVDMFGEQGLCTCSVHGSNSVLTREQLLRKTNFYGSTAVNIAVVSGSLKMAKLLNWAIEVSRSTSGELINQTSSSSAELTNERSISIYRYVQNDRLKLLIMKSVRGKGSEPVQLPAEFRHIPAPEVEDKDIHILDQNGKRMAVKVIGIIDRVLNDPSDRIDRALLRILMDACRVDVDFEFVPVAHVFLHFLASFELPAFTTNPINELRKNVMREIVEACMNFKDGEEGGNDGEEGGNDGEEGGNDGEEGHIDGEKGENDGKKGQNDGERGRKFINQGLVKILYSLLDPRGRTFVHSWLWEQSVYNYFEEQCYANISPTIKAECRYVTDGAGRTLFQLMCILNTEVYIDGRMYDDNRSLSVQVDHLEPLKEWCFPSYKRNIMDYRLTQVEFATLFNSTNLLDNVVPSHKRVNFDGRDDDSLRFAAMLGRNKFLKRLLENHTKFKSTKFKSLYDPGLGNTLHGIPAIHLAALFGQVEAIQAILKFPVYDPIVQDQISGTALHVLLDNKDLKSLYKYLQNIILFHLLPNTNAYKQFNNDSFKLQVEENINPKMYSSNEISCINLLLQAGIDIWTPSLKQKNIPSPGPMANDEARKWWYEKVVNEVVTLKTSINNAANATSVIATLVATASFIGPFQPPLGYGDSNGHYVQTNRSPVRVYLVCNSLSFFFSIASILMAVLPAIPMPKESLYDELFRSQRCLKGAALMLLISIICILISFSSASLAVVTPEWHERQLLVACIIVGGILCVLVLVIYIIRILRLLFHRNDWFRRKFAKYMYF